MSELTDPSADETHGYVIDADKFATNATSGAATELPHTSPQQQTKMPWMWLTLFCLGLFLIDLLALPILERAFDQLFLTWPNNLFIGWIYSQAFLAVIFSAVVGRVWLVGIAASSVFVVVSISMIFLSQKLTVNYLFFLARVKGRSHGAFAHCPQCS